MRWSRSSLSLLRSSRSCGEIIATGAGGVGASGAGAGTGASGTSIGLSVRARRGAMIAFSTLVEPHIGQATSPRLACLS